MSAYENEQIRQMGKALNEYSHAMSELAEAEEIDGRLIMTSPIKELCIGVGVATGIFFAGITIWAWIDGADTWIIVEFLLLVLLSVYCMGMGLFYKVVLTSEKITRYSSFFRIPKSIPLKKITRVVVIGGGDKIKLYRGRIKVLSLHPDLAGGCMGCLKYLEKAGIRIEYKGHSKLYYALRKY